MGRSPCCDKGSVKRGPWSPEEDAVLRSFVQRFSNAGNWLTLPHKAGLNRCGKSCRLRWLNYLRPSLRHGGFTKEEDNLILSLYGEIGSKWSVIAARLPSRTGNDVKNQSTGTPSSRRGTCSSQREQQRHLLLPATTASPPPTAPPWLMVNLFLLLRSSILTQPLQRSTTAESSRTSRSSCTPSSWGSSSSSSPRPALARLQTGRPCCRNRHHRQ
ncbi:hypothetical protein BRADI_2g48521v3 [Brachypodium distachyon]|uniref:Uncharacterized protein n=1 Tax=Brachypodium distachyon TaxID=15368 RepID=A0A2K2DEP0_BRADI|nr:hypothetical protein BRADI_2g48521v3 [Brachypodium distachyon]